MTEQTANAALYDTATKHAAERVEWQKKLAPAKPRIIKAKQKKTSIFKRIFGV